MVHQDSIRDLAFLQDGSGVFSVSGHEAILWDFPTGKRRLGLQENSSLMCGALSGDGRTAILAETGPKLNVFDIATGERRATLIGAKYQSFALALSSDGLRAASGDGIDIILWDVGSAKVLRRWAQHENAVEGLKSSTDAEKRLAIIKRRQGVGAIKALQFSPNEQFLAYAFSSTGEVGIYNLANEIDPIRLEGGAGSSAWLRFSPNGTIIAGSCEIGFNGRTRSFLRFWDPTTGKILKDVPGSFDYGAFAPDGTWLVAEKAIGNVVIYDTSSTNVLRRLPTSHGQVRAVAVSPDGTLIATGNDRRVRIWNRLTGQELHPASGHSEPIQAMAFSPDGKTIATGGLDGTLILWDWPAAKERKRVTKLGSSWGVQNLAYSPDGRTLAVTAHINSRDSHWLLDAATGKEIIRFGSGGPVLFVAGGREMIMDGANGSIAVRDATTGELIRIVGRFEGWMEALQPTADGTQAYWTGDHSGFGLRDLVTGEDVRFPVEPPESISNLALSSDGDLLASGSWVWDTRSREVISPGRGGTTAISPDGRLVASGGEGDIVLWEALTREQIHHFISPKGERDPHFSLAFSPDGTVLASTEYADVLVWDMTGYLKDGRLQSRSLSRAEMESEWKLLGSSQGWEAYQAAWTLAAAGAEAVAFLAEQVPMAITLTPDQIERYRDRFTHPDFAVREHAARDLADMGVELRPEDREALRRPDQNNGANFAGGINAFDLQGQFAVPRVLPANLPPPAPRRLLPPPTLLPLPERIQSSRAVMALEHSLAPAAAERLLSTLASGAPTAPLTREAKSALNRVRERNKSARAAR